MCTLKLFSNKVSEENISLSSLLIPELPGEGIDFEVESRRLFLDAIKSEFHPKFIYVHFENIINLNVLYQTVIQWNALF